MSIAGPMAAAASPRPDAVRPGLCLWSLPVAASLGCLLVLALTAAKAMAVWTTGIFFNPDDAMRAIEVRDLLGGQGWYDMVQHRLAPGHGVPMHWSRLADLPVAGLILPFEAVTSADTAERLARLIEPVLLLVGFMLCMARLGRTLIGERGATAACLLAVGGLETDSAFIPGHIHHHGLQVVLLMVLVVLVVEGVAEDARRVPRWVMAGGVAALTLAINLQNIPFLAVAMAALGLGWIFRGPTYNAAMAGFGIAVMAGTAAVFLIQVPADRALAATCDAFGAPHLLAAWLGGAGLLTSSVLSRRLPRPWQRGAALAALGVTVLVALRATYPACLGDPYSGVDPLLRTRWLAEVSEAMPLSALLRRDTAGTGPVAMALALGLVCLAMALYRERGTRRWLWAVITGFALAGLAGTLWEVRVAAATEPFAALGVAWALCRWFDPGRPSKPLAAAFCVFAGLGLTQAGWGAVLPPLLSLGRAPVVASAGPGIDPVACNAPESYAGLAALPAGLVLSTIDPGAQILAYTHHSVLAAAYHRNAYGNLLSLRAFDADPATAQRMLRDAGVRYVALCLTSPEVAEDRVKAPNGLAAQLAAGRVPPGMREVARGNGPVRVFELAVQGARQRDSQADDISSAP